MEEKEGNKKKQMNTVEQPQNITLESVRAGKVRVSKGCGMERKKELMGRGARAKAR